MTKATVTKTPRQFREWREQLNVSRSVLGAITGISQSRIWANEQDGKEVSDEHRAELVKALENIEKNGLPAEFARPAKKEKTPSTMQTKAQLIARIEHIDSVLAEAAEAKTIAQLRTLIESARLACIHGPIANSSMGTSEPAETTEA